jgi:hypothetical protein
MGRLASLCVACVVSVFVTLIVVGIQPDVTAQDDAAAMASHPLVGGWKVNNSPFVGDESFPSVALFHADGTYSEVLPWGAVLHCVWEPTGERTANMTFLLNDIIDDEIVEGEGRATIEIDAGGDNLSMNGNFISLKQDGSVDMAVESPSIATRLEALEMVPLGTPVIPPDVAEAAGTPTT